MTALDHAFEALWSDLDPIGRDGTDGGYRRFAWTREDLVLREWFAAQCDARGLDLVEDRVGNQWAWWGDPDAHLERTGEGGVVTGSHLDSVPGGGAFDGPLGVVSGLLAVDRLKARGVRPDRPIGLVNMVDEEGARFGVACAGSRILTGAMSAERALRLRDEEGVSVAEALRAAGRRPEGIGADPTALRRVGAFVELHVEQGLALASPGRLAALRKDGDEDLSAPFDGAVAVGSSIWPHGRWRIDLPGTANHAGTTALEDRDDAMLRAAQVVLEVRAAASRHDCVATVGRVEVTPNGVNAIPSRVSLSLDARGAVDDDVRATVSRVGELVRSMGGSLIEASWTDDTPFDHTLSQRVRGVLGPGTPVLPTGAGHDAGILATAGVPSAMLFVRNPTGVSHSPSEHAERADCLAGVDALTEVLADLSGGSAR